jgi:hypothetical protein
MNKYSFLLIVSLIILSFKLKAQDERFFRQIFSGDLKETSFKVQPLTGPKTYWYTASTPFYEMDLNQDDVPETIMFIKRDNEDWLEIFDFYKKKLFSYRFENMGITSGLYRIEKKRLSDETEILFLYYYVGVTQFEKTDSSARMYFLTIDKKDLSTIHVIKGPSYFEERKSTNGHYHQRKYNVELLSLNNDKYREVVIRTRGTNEVYIYAGNGKWKTFSR